MRLNVIFSYDVNPETGEMTLLSKEEITVDTATSAKKSASKATTTKVVENKEPLITLEPSKLVLTTGAAELLKAEAGCRIDIKYKKKDKVALPVIGLDTTFGTKNGNKFSQTNTISFRGSANEKLAEFGTTFKLEPSEDEGIFYMIGDKMNNPVPDDAIDIESELNIDDLDTIDLENGVDLEKFDFTL